ncbi:Expansin-like B1 [Acorus calamus]|uniref:Expansin-like B1 n=1 Tax=Acorus calamus TaxID=4465 RepID=A0AAV9EW26_ACOCL|nr:Expansin-like B1 [Acorus calamus]
MAFSLRHVAFIVFLLVLCETSARAATFTSSRAAYYPNSDQGGTSVGACGFGSFGVNLNGGDVSAASNLYRDGVGCGACYQVICTNSNLCSTNGVTVVITDSGASDSADFILSRHAFSGMGQTSDSGASLLSLGAVDIQYQRVSCNYPNNNLSFKIDESSNFPSYLAFVIWFQQGTKDVIAIQLCQTLNFNCKLLDRSHGAVWAVVSPPSGGPLSVRMLLSDGIDGDETWVVPTNNIPQNWKAGDVYDSGIQLN